MAKRSMSLVGFMQAGSTTVYAGSWRHPATEHGFLTAAYYAKLGRILEQGCFDMLFFDDRLAMPGIYGGSVAEAVRVGARPVKLDLSVVLGVIAGATERIGLGATYSTTYYSPFHVARTFGTLDHLTGGRAAWNVVTSVNDSEAQNFGVKEHLAHDERYDRADEFLEATTGLWDTWDDDALILDRVEGVFADPDKVHELHYQGKWYRVRGPLTVPRSPQGRPVLLQAGSSGRGRDFAARWAELIFTGDPDIDIARSHYKDQKERVGAFGRDPEAIKMLPMAYTVVGESHAHAEEREQVFLHDLVEPLASLTLLSELMNYDFSTMALDDVITDELVETWPGTGPRSCRDRGSSVPGPRWRTRCRSGSSPRRATASSSPPPTPRAPMRTWCAWSCPSSSGAACSAPATPGGPCATRSVSPGRRSAVAEPWGPLHGLRVIDAATLAAGPVVATALGEFGAEVIKVEQPGVGDPLRTWGECKNDIGLVWKSVNRNKRCVSLDLRVPEGQELFHRLLSVSDVLISNNRPSALARWHLDYESVHRDHPRVVMLHVSGYGGGGPKSDRPGFGTLAEAMSGFAHLTGQPDGPPTLPPFMLADGVAAMAATYAVVMALYHRDVHGGGGQLVDVNLIEPLARLIESSTLAYDQLGMVPGRVGNRLDASAPRNAYRTSDDRWLAVSGASPNIAARVFRAIGRPELAEDPAYMEPESRKARALEIDRLVADWVANKTLEQAMDAFEGHEVAAAPVYDASQLRHDPHLVARGTFVEVDDPEFGRVTVQAPVAILSETPGRVEYLGRSLGADNEAVFGGLLGVDRDRLAALRAAGTI
jgi:FMN-dependent oxidoreductase (nitrilotriacetate monooxygenase family)